MDEVDLQKYALELPEDEETQEWKQAACKKIEGLRLPKNQQTEETLELLGGYIAIARKNAFLQGFEMAQEMQKDGLLNNEFTGGNKNGNNKQNKKYYN